MGGDGKGTGAGTSFDGMSHEQMLQWLDQANAGTVQAAADRLTAAAREIRSIAEELKIRPQWVEWKGEGADAFRTWSGDLANATLRLGDFSDGAAKWLGEASGAIARAQASIPRDRAAARVNLDAATSTPNDPDAASIGAKSLRELAALEAAEEKVRQEAAAEMTKLGQAYRLSASQMEGLERPRFPPPPTAIVPRGTADQGTDLARPGDTPSSVVVESGPGLGGAGGVSEERGRDAVSMRASSGSASYDGAFHLPSLSDTEAGTRVGIESVAALPDLRELSATGAGAAPSSGRADASVSAPVSGFAPSAGGTAVTPIVSRGPGRPVVAGRVSSPPGQGAGAPSASGRGAVGTGQIVGRGIPGSGASAGRNGLVPGRGPVTGRAVPSSPAITGGRPTASPTAGGPVGRVPPGTTVGSGTAAGGGSTARGAATGAMRQGARSAGPARGIGPTPRDGIVGGTAQRNGRPPTPPGTPVPSAPTRGGISGGTPIRAGARDSSRARPGGCTTTGPAAQRERPSAPRREHPNAD
ncbi:translation initiation factor IF-2 [Streptomyces sp. NPDC005551]|uniref:translation initiation factor IF-2 n=1 Tax=Streptomyces sp. NPDC005551 TaxID=3364725 RepID=UPI0036B7DBB3